MLRHEPENENRTAPTAHLRAVPEETLPALETGHVIQATSTESVRRVNPLLRAGKAVGLAVLLLLTLASGTLVTMAGVQAKDRHNWTLITAIGCGDSKTVKQLLDQGYDPNARSIALNNLPWWKRPFNPFSGRIAALTLAANRGDITIVKALLEKGANPNVQDSIGSTPLIWVAGHNEPRYVAVMDTLIAHGADVNARNEYGGSPLTYAVGFGKVAMAKALLQHGADMGIQGCHSQADVIAEAIANRDKTAVADRSFGSR